MTSEKKNGELITIKVILFLTATLVGNHAINLFLDSLSISGWQNWVLYALLIIVLGFLLFRKYKK